MVNVISKNEIEIGNYKFIFKINFEYFNKCIFSIKDIKNNTFVLNPINISDNEMLNSIRYLYLITNDNFSLNQILLTLNNIIKTNNII